MTIQPMTVLGCDLREGDTIIAWFGRDTVTALRPYNGPLAYLWPNDGGARLAEFAINRTGMTVGPSDRFTVTNRR